MSRGVARMRRKLANQPGTFVACFMGRSLRSTGVESIGSITARRVSGTIQ